MRGIRIHELLLLVAASCVVFFPARTASGTQKATPPRSPNKFSFKAVTKLVQVPFIVTNRKHELVTDLSQSDFQVFEDGVPQSIKFFSRQTNLPLRIGILIDASNSIALRLHFEQEAAVDFLDQTIRPGKDKAFVVGFDVAPQLVQDYTDNVDALAEGIRSLQAGGSTALYDALFYACKEKMTFPADTQPYLRRVIVLISDGEDDVSQHSRDEALDMCEREQTTIYAISTNRSGLEGRGDKILQYLAQQTGGRAFHPYLASDLAESFDVISHELRNQYTLAYYPINSALDGTFRKITIMTDKKHLRVRARRGYFALAP